MVLFNIAGMDKAVDTVRKTESKRESATEVRTHFITGGVMISKQD